MSKKARPFSRRKAKAKRVRTESAAATGRADRRALMRQKVIASASVYEAERRGRNGQLARGLAGRSANFSTAQAAIYTPEQLAALSAAWDARLAAEADRWKGMCR